MSHFGLPLREPGNSRSKIKGLEEKKSTTVILRNPEAIQAQYRELVTSSSEEVMLFLPTTTAYRREEKIGLFDTLGHAADRGVNVRVLVPGGEENIEENLRQKLSSHKGKIEIRQIKTAKQTRGRAKIMIVDRKMYLMIELKDDTKEIFSEAVGGAIFSDSDSAVLSYLTMFESLWGQAELYEKLESHDRMQREFINIAAHELRTPTQAILGYSELLLQGKELSPDAEEMIESLNRNASRLQNLISYILDVARIEAGRLAIEKEQVDLDKLISTAVKDFQPQIEAAGKPVEISYDSQARSTPLIVNVDRGKVLQVLSNLLDNALKFTRQGRISISATTMTAEQENNGHAIVAVRDSGLGIDPEIFPRLFEKFASKSEKGTGLGLFISKSVIEAHGGKIWAQNNPSGQGATFTFTIPLSA